MSLLLVGGSATFYFAAIISVSWNSLFVKTLHVSLQKILCVFVFVSVCWNHFSGVGVL